MVAAALGKSGWERFRVGYVAALSYYLTTLYWLLLIPYRWHGIPLGPAAGWLALSGFAALFPASWVWLVAAVGRQGLRVHGPQSTVHGPETAVHGPEGVMPGSWVRRMLWALSGAAAWVAYEMVLARIFGGFPWDLLGVSQYRLVPLIQIASVTGVYGLSFLAVWLSLAMLSGGLMAIRRPTLRSSWLGEVVLPLLAVSVLFNLGLRQLRREIPPARTLRVTLVQPSIPQTLIWDANAGETRFRELLSLSERALSNRTELLLWPESALAKPLRYDQATFDAVTELARRHRVWIILVSDDFEPRAGAVKPEEQDEFNSSFLISPEGKVTERYIKRNLVIFGEYLPLERWLAFLKFFTPIEGGFTPGTHAVQFRLPDLGVQTTPLICFEDVFPHLARTGVEPETDFLVNLTNDGWFDESAEQWQQALSGLFRAVENGLPLLRCCNNGLTCWVDAQGRLRQVLRDERGGVYGAGFMTVDIPLRAAGERRALTFYTRHGDWFGWGCVGIVGITLLRRLRLSIRFARTPSALHS
jgi:apolipoprotein N-acyltransferase